MLKSILIRWTGNLSSVALLFKISENLLGSKLFRTSRKRPYFENNQLCAYLIYVCTYFAYARLPGKIEFYLEKRKFARRFEELTLKQIS